MTNAIRRFENSLTGEIDKEWFHYHFLISKVYDTDHFMTAEDHADYLVGNLYKEYQGLSKTFPWLVARFPLMLRILLHRMQLLGIYGILHYFKRLKKLKNIILIR